MRMLRNKGAALRDIMLAAQFILCLSTEAIVVAAEEPPLLPAISHPDPLSVTSHSSNINAFEIMTPANEQPVSIAAQPSPLPSAPLPSEIPVPVITDELYAQLTGGLPQEWTALLPFKKGDPLPSSIVITEGQVRWLIAHIDDDENYADHLKYGYFSRRMKGQWDFRVAFNLILWEMEEERKKCPPSEIVPENDPGISSFRSSTAKKIMSPDFTASRRWLRLASVASFANARVPELYLGPEYPWERRYLEFWKHAPTLTQYPNLFNRALADFFNTALKPPRNRRVISNDNALIISNYILPLWLPIKHVFPNEPMLHDLYADPRTGSYEKLNALVKAIAIDHEDNIAFQRRIGLLFYSFKGYDNRGESFSPEDAYPYRARAVTLPEFEKQPTTIRRELLDGLQDVCARLNRWDEAITAQERSVDTAEGSRAALARLHHRAADFLNKLRADVPVGILPDPDENSPVADAPPITTKTAEEHFALRDQVLAAALEDLARRDDIIPIARFLVELEREGEAVAFMDRFLAETKEADDHRLRTILELIRYYKKTERPGDVKRIAELCRPGDYKPSMPVIQLVTSINHEAQSIAGDAGNARTEKMSNPEP